MTPLPKCEKLVGYTEQQLLDYGKATLPEYLFEQIDATVAVLEREILK